MPINSPTNNLYSKPDLQSLRQALSLTSALYCVKRQITNHFDEKGRPNSKESQVYFEMAIVPNGDYKSKRTEQGSWTAESFMISYIYPDYLQTEDIITHPFYGELRVESINDMREYGVSTAVAVRINSIRKIINSGAWVNH
ncbi:MAG: hypothetical protein RR342_01105 [Bacilli bacterium]